ncbi:MAG TPA: hypothetical protein VHQ02_04810 [Usitatibacter sp.]|jgi:hypothetical protein|nr:hypothetical protein [Usitatibacter sp.]
MEIRKMAALGVSLWLAAAAVPSLAAEKAKAEPKRAPDSGEAKDAKAGSGAQPVKSAGPRLRMEDAPARNPGKDRDLRHCLDLPTPKEVIRCSEGK